MRRRIKRRYVSRATSHAKSRAAERYGVELSKDDLAAIVGKIRRNEAISRRKLTATRSEAIVEHKGVKYRVIYSKKIKAIVTCLPHIDPESAIQFPEFTS